MINLSKQNQQSSEVYLSVEDLVSINSTDIDELKQIAYQNPRQRVRFCSHREVDEPVHEMIIVHPQYAYVRPHKHLKKAESMLVLEGEVDYVIFNDVGHVLNIVPMGDYRSGKSFYQSVRTDLYHTLIIHSTWLVFLEITKGPFQRKDTIFAPWTPDDSDSQGIVNFIARFKETEL